MDVISCISTDVYNQYKVDDDIKIDSPTNQICITSTNFDWVKVVMYTRQSLSMAIVSLHKLNSIDKRSYIDKDYLGSNCHFRISIIYNISSTAP